MLQHIAEMNMGPLFATALAFVTLFGLSQGNLKGIFGKATSFFGKGEQFSYKGGIILGQIKLPPDKAREFEANMKRITSIRDSRIKVANRMHETAIDNAHKEYASLLRKLFLEYHQFEDTGVDVASIGEEPLELTDQETADDGLTIPKLA